jgi:DNA-binding MarR family transcriptional regulator
MAAAKDEKKAKVLLSPVDNLAGIAASAQAISNSVNSILRSGGARITLADWLLLRRLADGKDQERMGKMARQTGVTRQRIQKQVDSLAAAGMVDVQAGAEDKRIRLLKLTKLGKETLSSTSKIWSNEISKLEPTSSFPNLDGLRRRLVDVSTALVKLGNIGNEEAMKARKDARAVEKS